MEQSQHSNHVFTQLLSGVLPSFLSYIDEHLPGPGIRKEAKM